MRFLFLPYRDEYGEQLCDRLSSLVQVWLIHAYDIHPMNIQAMLRWIMNIIMHEYFVFYLRSILEPGREGKLWGKREKMKRTLKTVGSSSFANSALRISPMAAVPCRAFEPKSDIPACSWTKVLKSIFVACGRPTVGLGLIGSTKNHFEQKSKHSFSTWLSWWWCWCWRGWYRRFTGEIHVIIRNGCCGYRWCTGQFCCS